MSINKPIQPQGSGVAELYLLTTEPTWLRRDVEAPLGQNGQRAMALIVQHVYPIMEQLKAALQVHWVDNQVSQNEDAIIWHNLVMPHHLYISFKLLFDAAGFEIAPLEAYTKRFESQAGLKEALQQGADIGKKWH